MTLVFNWNYFTQMLDIQLTLVLFLAIGGLMYHIGIITPSNRPSYMRLLLEIFLPIMVFQSFSKITLELLRLSAVAALAGLIIYTLLTFIAPLFYRDLPKGKQPILHYATLVNNAGFAGLPLSQAMFGEAGAIIGSVYLVPHRIFTWTIGLEIFEQGAHATPWRETFWRLIKNPSIIAVILGLIRGLLHLPLPGFVDRGLGSIASAVQPMAMIVIGSIIATVDWRQMIEPGVLRYCLIRLLGIPLVVLFAMKGIGLDPTLTGVVTIMAGMPAGTPTPILASQYGLDVDFAAKITCVSIILSAFTCPILMMFI